MIRSNTFANVSTWQKDASAKENEQHWWQSAAGSHGAGAQEKLQVNVSPVSTGAHHPTVAFTLPPNHSSPRGRHQTPYAHLYPNGERAKLVVDEAASPSAFRISFVTNRSSYMTPKVTPNATPNATPTACSSIASKALNFFSSRLAGENKRKSDVPFPFVPGQRLIVKSCAALRLKEDKCDPNNPIVADLTEGELVYFLKAGAPNRLKVQSISTNCIGWVSWKVESSGLQIFAIQPREV